MVKLVYPPLLSFGVFAFAACGGEKSDAVVDPPATSNPDGGTGRGGASVDGGAIPSSPSGSPSIDGGTAAAGEPELELRSEDIYTGSDGQHSFDIPIAAMLVKYPADPNADATAVPFTSPPTFAVADPAIATVNPIAKPSSPLLEKSPFLSLSSFAVISPKAPGQTSLTITYGTQKVTAAIHVTAYSAAQYTLGQQRYTQPANPGAQRLACTQCHNAAAKAGDAGSGATPHDPFIQQDLPDNALVGIVTKGLWDLTDPTSKLDVPGGHSWDLTAEEQAALPAYLRSLHTLGF